MTHKSVYKKVVLLALFLAVAISFIQASPAFAGTCSTAGQSGC